MTLIVEDGTGRADAQSYISVTDADTYISEFYGADDEWDALSDAEKEQHLRQSTQHIDGKYKFRSVRSYEVQSLAWPRSDVVDDDGFAIDYDVIPEAVKRATVEYAIRIVNGTDVAPDVAIGGQVKRTKEKVGPIETETEYQDGASPMPKFTQVDQLLKRLTRMPYKLERA